MRGSAAGGGRGAAPATATAHVAVGAHSGAGPDAGWAFVGYRRVSKDEQASEWRRSLERQTEAITDLARRLGGELDPTAVWEDRFSGEAVAGRPGFQGLMAYCRTHPRPAHAPGRALFDRDNRFGRFEDPDEAAALRFQLKQWGWVACFVVNGGSGDPATDHLVRAVGATEASRALTTIKTQAKAGARDGAELGLWLNEAPLGYRRVVQPGRHVLPAQEYAVLARGQRKPEGSTVKLGLGPEAETEAVRWLFATYAAGTHSLFELAAAMDRRCPGWQWSKQAVRQKLTNPAYVGDVIWCRRPHNKAERDALPKGVRPKDRWAVCEDAHPPLISRTLFARVAQRLHETKPVTCQTAGGYPLTGLLTCVQCGAPYVGGGGAINRRGPDRDRYRFYKCAGSVQHVAGEPARCPGPIFALRKRVVEPAVLDAVAELMADPAVVAAVAAQVRRRLAGEGAPAAATAKRLTARVRQLEQEQGRLVHALKTGVMTDEVLKPEAERVARDLAAAREALAAVKNGGRRDAAADLDARIAAAVRLAGDFRARTTELSGPALREFLRLFLAWGRVDKAARTITVGIRRLPLAPDASTPEPPHGGGRSRRAPAAPAPQVTTALAAATTIATRTLRVGRGSAPCRTVAAGT